MKINDVLLKPIVTEKGVNLVKTNVYTFEVNLKANKDQVKKTLEKLYKVKVSMIKVSIRKGKMKKAGKRMILKQLPNRKIAYIRLREGKIDLFPQS